MDIQFAVGIYLEDIYNLEKHDFRIICRKCHCNLHIVGHCRFLNIYRPRSEGDNVLGNAVRPFVCLLVRALLLEPFDL